MLRKPMECAGIAERRRAFEAGEVGLWSTAGWSLRQSFRKRSIGEGALGKRCRAALATAVQNGNKASPRSRLEETDTFNRIHAETLVLQVWTSALNCGSSAGAEQNTGSGRHERRSGFVRDGGAFARTGV